MAFYEDLRARLEGLLSDELPRGYQLVGKVLLLRLKPSLLRHRKTVGRAVLDILPYVHAVFLIKGMKDVERRPVLELLAARPGPHAGPLSQTIHSEHGCRFMLDLRKVMWAAGNKGEKLRLLKLVRRGETIVDMFAGIGYWSIPIAKHSKVKRIYAIDINPNATEFLRRNAIMNGVESKIEVLQGDCRLFAKPLKGTADRIIMGYLQDTEKYLPAAFAMAKPQATLHFHRAVPVRKVDAIKEKIARIAAKHGRKVKFLAVRRVKGYAPAVDHLVFDIKVQKRKT
jgi:tRNA wybutosine-synthesizing protein 2